MSRTLAAVTALLTATAALVIFSRPATSQAPPQEGPDLVAGLKATPGCLGVDTAQTSSRKNVIFAWFKDKAAVKRWYYSETHQGAMDTLFNGDEYAQTKPLAHVPDGTGPILVIASLTPSAQPQLDAINMPISQIAIELYQPLPGGAFIEGRFAPKDVAVKHMRDYTPHKALGSD
jgi:quinol monooxygenase YgiN